MREAFRRKLAKHNLMITPEEKKRAQELGVYKLGLKTKRKRDRLMPNAVLTRRLLRDIDKEIKGFESSDSHGSGLGEFMSHPIVRLTELQDKYNLNDEQVGKIREVFDQAHERGKKVAKEHYTGVVNNFKQDFDYLLEEHPTLLQQPREEWDEHARSRLEIISLNMAGAELPNWCKVELDKYLRKKYNFNLFKRRERK